MNTLTDEEKIIEIEMEQLKPISGDKKERIQRIINQARKNNGKQFFGEKTGDIFSVKPLCIQS
jgi:hypothetical protein